MASTFAGMSSVGSLAAGRSLIMDNKLAHSSNKLSSLASISSTSFGRRRNVVLRKTRSTQIMAAAKELYFNKDGSAIRRLQVGFEPQIYLLDTMFTCHGRICNCFFMLLADWC